MQSIHSQLEDKILSFEERSDSFCFRFCEIWYRRKREKGITTLRKKNNF